MKNILLFFILAFITIFGCEKEKLDTKLYNVSGCAQKGPYVIGTNITLSELDSELNPTGRNYYTNIKEYNGSFDFPDIEFSSNYVKLIADGTYYNEVNGTTGYERLTLISIADLNDSSTININILTHLESERLQYLIKTKGLSFSEAKVKAKNEILAIFNLDFENISNFEHLDITKSGTDNAKLLAISCIIQGNWSRSISELTELLAKIRTDIQEDGTFDDQDIIYDLKLHAELLRYNEVEENLKNKYSLTTIPDYQKMINYYLDNNEVETHLCIKVPDNTNQGINLISITNGKTISQDSTYCIASNIHYVHTNDSIVYNVVIEKDDNISWNFSNGSQSSIDGWFYYYYEDIIRFELKEQDRLCIIPIELTGTGKLTVRIDIDALKTGSTSVTREIYVE